MNDSAHSKQIHTGKSSWVYIAVGLASQIDRDLVAHNLSQLEGWKETDVFLTTIPIPLNPPSSQVQAALWSNQYWPSVYRKSNPLGPHPGAVSRGTDEIAGDASVWMTLAHQVAAKAKATGYGEAMGACVVQRSAEGTRIVALAADARWHKQEKKTGGTGNPMAHAVLRAISMVAQKLVRAENKNADGRHPPILEFEAFQDRPLLPEEEKVFGEKHPSPDGYLCHGLELYVTHEPCVMCSMAILHSRMGKVIFSHKMPLTGGMAAEDRKLSDLPHLAGYGGGRGLGLFWRRELNWSLMAWEWEPTSCCKPLLMEPTVHA